MRPTSVGETCRNYRPRPATPEGDVRRIPFGGGLYAYVDAADYEWLSQYHWSRFSGGYAARRDKTGKWILMHREIMQAPDGTPVDHHDGNKANNCRFNLRICTADENRHNQALRSDSTSGFKGVSLHKRSGKYRAKFTHSGHHFYLGSFADPVEAARAYDYKAVQCCGPFARVNLPEEWPPDRIQQVHAAYQADLKNAPVPDTSSQTNADDGAGRGSGESR